MINCVRMGSCTMIGTEDKLPLSHGNCFGLYGEDDKHYKILNFVYENFERLLELEIIKYPIKVIVTNGIGYICDERIDPMWYKQTICTICAPVLYWDVASLIKRITDVQSRRVKMHKGFTERHIGNSKVIDTSLLSKYEEAYIHKLENIILHKKT